MKREDLTGRVFGELTVLSYVGDDKWHCKCSCGREKDILQYSLTSENPKNMIRSCGHTRVKDELELIGKTFEDITIISNEGRGKYKAQCKCGAIKIVAGGDIRRGKAIRCTHNKNYEQYIGRKFGELEVLNMDGATATCKCKCGKIEKYPLSVLLQGKRVSCGCLRKSKQLKNSLVGRQIGFLKVEELLENNMYKCKCICGNETIIKASNLRQGQRSCGCMANRLHSETIDKRLGRKRTEEQLEAISSKDKLESFIKENCKNEKISLTLLASLLGFESVTSIGYYIDKFGLRNYILDSSLTSQPEQDILNFVKSEVENVEIIQHAKGIIGAYELDIYIPELKLAIEYNGTYWHSDIHKEKMYHQEKTIACAKKGIHLIHVFGYEWAHNKEKIKNIIKITLHSQEITRVYARETIVSEISKEESDTFLNQYHMQGSCRSSIHIGLKKDDKLLAVMTLGNPRFNHKYQYEIHRLCFLPELNIVGGASKLYKHFIRNYNPDSVLTYVDISKFTGNSYLKLGFKPLNNDCITVPNYKWVSRDETSILKRYETQKDKLLDADLGIELDTEDSIMRDLEYYKVYDCGNLKLEWVKEL